MLGFQSRGLPKGTVYNSQECYFEIIVVHNCLQPSSPQRRRQYGARKVLSKRPLTRLDFLQASFLIGGVVEPLLIIVS